MSKIRGKDTKMEVMFRKELWKNGFRYRKNSAKYFGKPDMVLKKYKTVIFLDSCFWHGCNKHGTTPVTRKVFWVNKISRNKERDREVSSNYKKAGWKTFRFWEHDIEKNLEKSINEVVCFLNERDLLDLKVDPRRCAKRYVVAIIEKNGKYYVGSNWCRNQQKECPRLPDEDYSKCKTICEQDGHAEIDAIKNAKGDTEEAIMYLIGHDYCCEPCLASMKKAGIKTVIFNSYPKGFKKNCLKKNS